MPLLQIHLSVSKNPDAFSGCCGQQHPLTESRAVFGWICPRSFDCQKKATEFASNQKLRREDDVFPFCFCSLTTSQNGPSTPLAGPPFFICSSGQECFFRRSDRGQLGSWRLLGLLNCFVEPEWCRFNPPLRGVEAL